MLESIIRQQPDLFNNVVKNWHAITGSKLLFISPDGTPLKNTRSESISERWAEIHPHISDKQPVFLQPFRLLAAPLVHNNEPLGYLMSVNVDRAHLPLIEWMADELLARVLDFFAMQSMTDELIGAWDQLELIFRVTENLALNADLHSVLKSILHEIQKVTHTEDGFILLSQPDTLLCVSVKEDRYASLCRESLLEYIIGANRIVLQNSFDACRKFWPTCPPYVKNFLATPLMIIQDNAQAAIGLVNKTTDNFNAGDVKLLAALAHQVASVINNHLTHRRLVVKERISRELEIAAEIQVSLLPTQLPHMGGIAMAVSAIPASEVGGDFYDFIALDERYLTIVMGDVSGKGIPAAMLTSVTRTMLRVEAMRGDPPHKIIRQANHLLFQDLSRADSFVTVFVATLDTVEGKLIYASAGHVPVLLWRARSHQVELLKATSLPIGVFSLPENYSRTVDLEPGDTLVFYTDGFTEARSPDDDFFGLDRLIDAVAERAGDTPENLMQHIQSQVNAFRQGAEWPDDASLLVMKSLAKSESISDRDMNQVLKTEDFRYPADMDYLSEISQDVAGTCRELAELPHGARGDDFIYLIELAISEICTNIVKHAYAGTTGDISGQITLLNNGVQLDFYDQGRGFDLNSVPQPEANPNELREGGYGLHIVRQIMDVVSYESDPDGGNHWHLIKFLPSQK
jgi:sigma-B regulation protein RsbU (phosphoserine phosphatase)